MQGSRAEPSPAPQERSKPVPRLILAARAAKGWSQGRLIRESGLSRMDVYRIERGLHDPGAAKALRLVEVLGIPPAVMRAAIDGDAETVDRYIAELGEGGGSG